MEILGKQSFRLMDKAGTMGVLVTGTVQAVVDARNRDCFVTLIAPNAAPVIVIPDKWESSLISCDGVRAVGTLGVADRNTAVHIGVIFMTGVYFSERRDSGYTKYDAVVLVWNATDRCLDVDREDTEKAFKATAETLPDLQQALSK